MDAKVKAKARVRSATLEDVAYIASRMREADRVEVAAFGGIDGHAALHRGFAYSELCWTGTVDHEPACMFGFCRRSLLSDTGIPWLLGTDLVASIPHAFVRTSRKIVREVMASGIFSRLENWVDSQNEISIRWLKFLDFTVHADRPVVVRSRTFYPFSQGG